MYECDETPDYNEKIEVEYDLKIKYRTSDDKEHEIILLDHTFEVYGRTWREDMHPDGIGYWETFAEEKEGALDTYLDDLKVPFKNYDEAEADQQSIMDRIYEDETEDIDFENLNIIQIIDADIPTRDEVKEKQLKVYRHNLVYYINIENYKQVANTLKYIYTKQKVFDRLESMEHVVGIAKMLLEQVNIILPVEKLYEIDSYFDRMFSRR